MGTHEKGAKQKAKEIVETTTLIMAGKGQQPDLEIKLPFSLQHPLDGISAL